MAPSPELGQPKAPDKVHKTNKVNPADADSLSGAGATTGHVTAVQREKKSMNATTSAAITNTQPADAEVILVHTRHRRCTVPCAVRYCMYIYVFLKSIEVLFMLLDAFVVSTVSAWHVRQ